MLRGQHVHELPHARHQLWHVVELGEALHHLVAASRVGLKRRYGLAELPRPGVEGRDAALAEFFRGEEPHDRVQLAHGVRHRRARCEHHRAARPLALQVARLDVHVERAPRAVGVDALDLLVRREVQLAEGMGLVHVHEVRANVLELDRGVLLAGTHDAVEALRHRLDLLLKLRTAYPVGLAGVVQLGLQVVEDLIADGRDGFLLHADALESAVRDDDGVGCVERGCGDESLAALGREVLIVRHHDVRQRVQLHELVGELLEHVVRHRVDGLVDEPQALLLHAASDHLDGLAGAHRMREVGVAGLHLAPDGALLVRVQAEAQAHARQRHVRTVEATRCDVVEPLVVKLH